MKIGCAGIYELLELILNRDRQSAVVPKIFFYNKSKVTRLNICGDCESQVVVVVVDSSANITLAVSTWCFFELCFL